MYIYIYTVGKWVFLHFHNDNLLTFYNVSNNFKIIQITYTGVQLLDLNAIYHKIQKI